MRQPNECGYLPLNPSKISSQSFLTAAAYFLVLGTRSRSFCNRSFSFLSSDAGEPTTPGLVLLAAGLDKDLLGGVRWAADVKGRQTAGCRWIVRSDRAAAATPRRPDDER